MSDHPCVGCRFAEWKRTATGRLHPDRSGKCVWKGALVMPAAVPIYEVENIKRVIERPQYIERGRWPMRDCPTREQEPPHA